jgi:hypothetical protein
MRHQPFVEDCIDGVTLISTPIRPAHLVQWAYFKTAHPAASTHSSPWRAFTSKLALEKSASIENS